MFLVSIGNLSWTKHQEKSFGYVLSFAARVFLLFQCISLVWNQHITIADGWKFKGCFDDKQLAIGFRLGTILLIKENKTSQKK